MQIGCPQCSTQYDLDPRLLPPAGASVQCTRCSFVFTALPSGEVVAPNPGEVSRTPSSGSTRIFGTPYGARPPAGSRTPAMGSSAVGGSPAPLGKTQVFGAPAPRAPAPPTTTQVFGAVSVPPSPAPAPAPAPPATTTQVFGAVSLPETRPPSASTTQVFGASAIPAAPASPTTTQVFGAGAVREAQQAAGRSGPSEGASEPAAAPSPSRSTRGGRPAVAPPPAPISLPPEAPVALPAPPPAPISAPVSLPPEPLPERGAVTGSSRRLTALEQAPELFDRIERQDARGKPAKEGGKERLLIALAAVVVLGLTAWLTFPAWRNRGSELPAEALRAKEEAVQLLRRDDVASRERALAHLRPLVAQFPKFTEAQAELGVALALQLDDTKVELEWIGEQEARLRKEIDALTMAQAPADWSNRVNAGKEELEALGAQRRPLEASVAELTKQLEAAQLIIRAAPETEPAADVVARLKAQAVHAGVTGNPHALALAERLRKVEHSGHWSTISLAEYGLNARSPAASLAELSQALQAVRERDTTFIRAYVLGARLALRQKDPATARSLLDSVEALNPHHALARRLRAWATPAAAAP